MVTCCDCIFFMRDTYIRNVTERQFAFGEARAPQGEGLSALNVFVNCFLRFLFSSRSFVNKD